MQDEARFGFIIMDGMGTLYGTVQVRESLCSIVRGRCTVLELEQAAVQCLKLYARYRCFECPVGSSQPHLHRFLLPLSFSLWPQGNTRDVLHKFSVDLPKKHGRGGQSSVRFARLRVEKRHNYMRKVGCNRSMRCLASSSRHSRSALRLHRQRCPFVVARLCFLSSQVAELAQQLFIPSGQMPSIKGLVLAGA